MQFIPPFLVWCLMAGILLPSVSAASLRSTRNGQAPRDPKAEAQWRLGRWAHATGDTRSASSSALEGDADAFLTAGCSLSTSATFCPHALALSTGAVAFPSALAGDCNGHMYLRSDVLVHTVKTYSAWAAGEAGDQKTRTAAANGATNAAAANDGMDAAAGNAIETTAIAVSTGDVCLGPRLFPIIAHCRSATSGAADGVVLWPGLRSSRVSLRAAAALARAVDIPWREKRPTAVWRSEPNGGHLCDNSGGGTFLDGPCAPGKVSGAHVVNKFKDDPLFDVGLRRASPAGLHPEYVAAGLVAGELTVETQLRYKVVLTVDGATCASLLAWALPSRSVVAMAYPFLMENHLMYSMQPWEHFIPYSADLSDLKQNIRWCFDNDAACEQIAVRAALLIRRLEDDGYELEVQRHMLPYVSSAGRFVPSAFAESSVSSSSYYDSAAQPALPSRIAGGGGGDGGGGGGFALTGSIASRRRRLMFVTRVADEQKPAETAAEARIVAAAAVVAAMEAAAAASYAESSVSLSYWPASAVQSALPSSSAIIAASGGSSGGGGRFAPASSAASRRRQLTHITRVETEQKPPEMAAKARFAAAAVAAEAVEATGTAAATVVAALGGDGLLR